MIGRREFAMTGMSAIALAAMQGRTLADDHEHGHKGAMSDCAKACSNCQRECDACGHHCATLLADGKKEHLRTLQTCQDCADVCAAAAQIVARQGAFASLICEACIEACAKCAEACEKFPNDKSMLACAKECRACEKACREMVKHLTSSLS